MMLFSECKKGQNIRIRLGDGYGNVLNLNLNEKQLEAIEKDSTIFNRLVIEVCNRFMETQYDAMKNDNDIFVKNLINN